jgi:hypothetical protein
MIVGCFVVRFVYSILIQIVPGGLVFGTGRGLYFIAFSSLAIAFWIAATTLILGFWYFNTRQLTEISL